MKRIILLSIEMWNFKGEAHTLTNFNASVTTISGDNGLGKSRHFDAFNWCLFGKDAFDRTDYEIKSRINGKTKDKVNAEVEVVIMLDNEMIKLHRALVEDWVKPRGQKEEVFKGNHTECYMNDVPLQVGEYKKRINEIIDESLFKLITNPIYFSTLLDWKSQRAILYQIAGEIADQDVAGTNEEFVKLLNDLNGKSWADFKAELTAKLRKVKDRPKEINIRIDQIEKDMPADQDWNELQKQLESVDENLKNLESNIRMIENARQTFHENQQKIRDEIRDLEVKQKNVVFEAQKKELQRCQDANIERSKLTSEIMVKEQEVKSLQLKSDKQEERIEVLKKEIQRLNIMMDSKRSEWKKKKVQEYDGSDICPHCQQRLPLSMIQRARNLFDEQKNEVLAGITAEGKRMATRLEDHKKELNALYQDSVASKLGLTNSQLSQLREKLAGMPEVKPQPIVKEELSDWQEIQMHIDELRAKLKEPAQSEKEAQDRQQRTEYQKKRDEIMNRLNDRKRIQELMAQKKALQDQLDSINDEVADLEQKQYQIMQFEMAKADMLQERINGKFESVRFQLFQKTLDGNVSETCVPLVEGVPFGAANTAGKINAGLEIINALCQHYQVSAPIFIDNAESVNTLAMVDSQIIRLKVTMDPKITIQ